jgi:hypothetical protein
MAATKPQAKLGFIAQICQAEKLRHGCGAVLKSTSRGLLSLDSGAPIVRIFQNNCQPVAISQIIHLFNELNLTACLDDLTAVRL